MWNVVELQDEVILSRVIQLDRRVIWYVEVWYFLFRNVCSKLRRTVASFFSAHNDMSGQHKSDFTKRTLLLKIYQQTDYENLSLQLILGEQFYNRNESMSMCDSLTSSRQTSDGSFSTLSILSAF